MSTATPLTFKPKVYYPDSDGEPMSDNTVQFDWIGLLKWNLEAIFRDRPDVFVAGDHLIYPIEGDSDTRQAPDVYVAFGRPKTDRGSYKVWEECGIFPQVVFEVWSPSNRFNKMLDKLRFYERFGAEEYFIVTPEFPAQVDAWRRDGDRLVQVTEPFGWVSPRLGIRFERVRGQAVVYGPDGRALLRPDAIAAERDAERERARVERERANRLAAKLRELGIDPDTV